MGLANTRHGRHRTVLFIGSTGHVVDSIRLFESTLDARIQIADEVGDAIKPEHSA